MDDEGGLLESTGIIICRGQRPKSSHRTKGRRLAVEVLRRSGWCVVPIPRDPGRHEEGPEAPTTTLRVAGSQSPQALVRRERVACSAVTSWSAVDGFPKSILRSRRSNFSPC